MDYRTFLEQYVRLLELQNLTEESVDYTLLSRHIGFLKQLAVVENSSIVVLDVLKKDYAFVYSHYLNELGLSSEQVLREGPKTVFMRMHPEDLPIVLDTHFHFTKFLMSIPPEEKKNYKSIYEFRIKGADNKYHRFVQQIVPLELDTEGNIWLILMVNDMLPLKEGEFTFMRKVVNVTNNKVYLFMEDDEAGSKSLLTKREIEILGLLAKGVTSKQVADQLFLSINTVNNHRRNILSKMSAENTAEAINYAATLGLV